MLPKSNPSSKFFLTAILSLLLSACVVEEPAVEEPTLEFSGIIKTQQIEHPSIKSRFHWKSYADHSVLSFTNSVEMILAQITVYPQKVTIKTIDQKTHYGSLDQLGATLFHRKLPLSHLFDALTAGTLQKTQIGDVTITPQYHQDHHLQAVLLDAPDYHAQIKITDWTDNT